MRVQPFSQAWPFWKFENPAVVDDAGTHITAAQGNNPNPPATAKQMVRGPFTARATRVGVIWKTFSPFVAVPLFRTVEPRPYRVDRMLGVRTKMSKLSREHGRASGCIDNPTAPHPALIRIDNCIDGLSVRAIQVGLCHFSGTPEIAARLDGELQHMRIEFRAINLKGCQSALVA